MVQCHHRGQSKEEEDISECATKQHKAAQEKAEEVHCSHGEWALLCLSLSASLLPICRPHLPKPVSAVGIY